LNVTAGVNPSRTRPLKHPGATAKVTLVRTGDAKTALLRLILTTQIGVSDHADVVQDPMLCRPSARRGPSGRMFRRRIYPGHGPSDNSPRDRGCRQGRHRRRGSGRHEVAGCLGSKAGEVTPSTALAHSATTTLLGAFGSEERRLFSRPRKARRRVEKRRRASSRQYESDESTSPPVAVASAYQVGKLIESLMNLTLPSDISTLTPPECQLRAEKKP